MSSPYVSGGENLRGTAQTEYVDDSIDLKELFLRVWKGVFQIIGLILIGVALAAVISLAARRLQPQTTSTRISFTFPGFERGLYPDGSKFQPDDLRAPSVINDALQHLGFDTSSDFQSKIRGAITIEAIVPPNIIKERDRLRAAGQTPPAYTPDEYTLSLTMKPDEAFPATQRERLLSEIVTVYRNNFYRTFGQPPLAFGTAFETLKAADYAEYELVLNSEVENIRQYLRDQANVARSFRSPRTNFSFKDLAEQTELFAQIQLNESLGLIHQHGLSRNRQTAMLKMNYYLRQLEEQERRAIEEEKVVRDLLAQAQSREQSYVLGVKSAAQNRPDGPMLDQGLIDSLLANDSYNFLVRRALDAGLAVKRIQAEKNRLIDQRDNMQSFIQSSVRDQSDVVEQTEKSIAGMQAAYQSLVDNIRKTHADYSRQEYGNAIRITDAIRTPGFFKPLAIAMVIGAFIGAALGGGLSLLGIYIGRTRRPVTA